MKEFLQRLKCLALFDEFELFCCVISFCSSNYVQASPLRNTGGDKGEISFVCCQNQFRQAPVNLGA